MKEVKYLYHLEAERHSAFSQTLLLVSGRLGTSCSQVPVAPLLVPKFSQESLLSQQVSVLLLETQGDVTVKTQR